MRRLRLLLLAFLLAAACTPAADEGPFSNFRVDGHPDGSMQVCIGAGHGVADARVEMVNLDTGTIFAEYTTDARGWFTVGGGSPRARTATGSPPAAAATAGASSSSAGEPSSCRRSAWSLTTS